MRFNFRAHDEWACATFLTVLDCRLATFSAESRSSAGSQVNHERASPDAGRNRSARRRRQQNQIVRFAAHFGNCRPIDRALQIFFIAPDWANQREAAETRVQMFQARTKLSNLGPE